VKRFYTFLFTLLALSLSSITHAKENLDHVRYGKENIDGINIFYRETGDPSKKAVVLLHGFPTSSHMYREVLAELGDEFYLIAPDYPGYGDSDFPAQSEYTYTFDNIAETMDQFLIKRGLKNYTLMIQDYGAPIGFRIATKHPEKVSGFVVMNGNAYEEGLSPEGWAPIMKYWKDKNQPELEKTITEQVFSLEGLKWQYTHGTRNQANIKCNLICFLIIKTT